MNGKAYCILFALFIIGCKKQSLDAKPVTVTCNTADTFQIALNGFISTPRDIIPGDTVNFQAFILKSSGGHSYYSFEQAALEGCTLLWNFGDGFTSAELNSTHVYDSSGTYMVQMILNGDSTNVISRSLYIGPSPGYTQTIAGSRQWTRTRIVTDGPTNISDTTITDTTFTINIVDKETISIGEVPLTYSPGSSSAEVFLYLSTGGFPICSLLYYPGTNKTRYVVTYGWWMTDRYENK